MLSERLKRDLREATCRPAHDPVYQELCRMGPAAAVQYLIDADPGEYPDAPVPEDVKELIENRGEAERLVAGFLGFM